MPAILHTHNLAALSGTNSRLFIFNCCISSSHLVPNSRLPAPWKPCESEDGEIFYFNFETGAMGGSAG